MSHKAAGLNFGAASDADLKEGAQAIECVQRLLDATRGQLLAELDGRGTTDRDDGLKTGSWLARAAGLPKAVASKRVAVGLKLRTLLPEVLDALVDGRISWDHARGLADAANPRVADKVAELQTQLINLAQGTVFEQWKREVIGIVDLLDEDGAHDPNDDLERNRLSLSRTFDGTVELSGRLVGDLALITEHAIQTKADELFRRFTADRERCPDIKVPGRATLRALALGELIRQGQGIDLATTQPPRTEVSLIVRADEPDDTTGVDGVRLQDGSTRVLRCDPVLHPIVVNGLGVPLDMGRQTRFGTQAQRRAAVARDGACCFPGCDCPASWSDLHHLTPWAAGGETNTNQLATLCRHHHGVTHRTGWHMHATDDGWFWWETPTGHTFWSQRHGHQRAGPPPEPEAPESG